MFFAFKMDYGTKVNRLLSYYAGISYLMLPNLNILYVLVCGKKNAVKNLNWQFIYLKEN